MKNAEYWKGGKPPWQDQIYQKFTINMYSGKCLNKPPELWGTL